MPKCAPKKGHFGILIVVKIANDSRAFLGNLTI